MMNAGRCYPIATTLANGDVLVVAGSKVLIAGGASTPTATAEVVDLGSPQPA